MATTYNPKSRVTKKRNSIPAGSEVNVSNMLPSTPATRTASSPTVTQQSSSTTHNNNSNSNKKRGWDDIESIFDQKKAQQQQEKKKNDADEKSRATIASQSKSQKRRPSSKANTPMNDKMISNNNNNNNSNDSWVNDGLGGVYNHEGFTGRTEDGIKIFKAHIISKQKNNAGQTKDCPFDCDCCFI